MYSNRAEELMNDVAGILAAERGKMALARARIIRRVDEDFARLIGLYAGCMAMGHSAEVQAMMFAEWDDAVGRACRIADELQPPGPSPAGLQTQADSVLELVDEAAAHARANINRDSCNLPLLYDLGYEVGNILHECDHKHSCRDEELRRMLEF